MTLPTNASGFTATIGNTGSIATFTGNDQSPFVAALAANPSGGSFFVLPGTYNFTNVVGISVSNVTFVFDPHALIILPATPTWVVLVSQLGAMRSPLFTISDASYVSFYGGQFMQVPGGSNFQGTGLHVGHTCNHIIVEGCAFSNFQRFAVLTTAWDNIGGGLGVGGQIYDINVRSCRFDTCGTGGTTKDGGGIRFGNEAGAGVTSFGFYAIRNFMTAIQMFGIDVNNPKSDAGPMQNIVISENEIFVGMGSSALQACGIYLEKSGGGKNTYEVMVVDNHVVGGYHCLKIESGVQQVIVRGGVYDTAFRSPIQLSSPIPNAGTLSDVLIEGVIAKNGGQSGSAFGGIEISAESTSDPGTITNIQIVNCRALDDQGPGHQTQMYGLNLNNPTTGGSPTLNINNVRVIGGTYTGNAPAGADINIDLTNGPSGTPGPSLTVPVQGDNRTVTGPDLSAITLWSPRVIAGSNNAVFQVAIYLNAVSYSSGSAMYVFTYRPPSGTLQTVTLSALSVGQNAGMAFIMSVVGGSAITGQVTGPFVGSVTVSVVLTQVG